MLKIKNLAYYSCNCKKPHYNDRKTPISVIVLHATHTTSIIKSLTCLIKNETSSHYIVDRNGNIFSLVPDKKRAWHAGKSSWDGLSDINSRSIGIEIQSDYPYNFTHKQMNAVTSLCKKLMKDYNIPAHGILGHSDVAPNRKVDPGKLFFWKELARHGIGIYPPTLLMHAPPYLDKKKCLEQIGYNVEEYGLNCCKTAFRDHFIGSSNRPFNDTLFTVSQLFGNSRKAVSSQPPLKSERIKI